MFGNIYTCLLVTAPQLPVDIVAERNENRSHIFFSWAPSTAPVDNYTFLWCESLVNGQHGCQVTTQISCFLFLPPLRHFVGWRPNHLVCWFVPTAQWVVSTNTIFYIFPADILVKNSFVMFTCGWQITQHLMKRKSTTNIFIILYCIVWWENVTNY